MKKLLGLAVLLCTHNAYSEVLPILKDVDCANLEIKVAGVNGDVYVYTEWNKEDHFPNPPKKVYAGDYVLSQIKKYRIECPNVSINYDGNELSVKGNQLDTVLDFFYNGPKNSKPTGAFKDIYNYAIPIYSSGSYEFPNLKMGFRGNSYKLDLKTLDLQENNFILKEPKNYKDQYQVSKLNEAIIGYSIDDEEIKPFFYNSILYPVKDDFKKANKISIYHKRSQDNDIGIIFEKIEIDKTRNTVKLSKKFEFPKAM
ncbi:hypothetical protein [Acinetobacter soli]|uniref:hypothetical protein n=1 Tax=Acinetobacter soli TaxID=487316 RepID=UPI000E5BED30|nr:hypothetical protein [Acinetobacter soli]